MRESFAIIASCTLFDGIAADELSALLRCLAYTEKTYKKNSFVFREDEAVTSVGIVLSGAVLIVQEDYWGKRTILARFGPGGLFGEAFACAGLARLPVGALASEDARVLHIDYRKIVTGCPSACTFHTTLIKNMLRILARRNVMLTQKIGHLTRPTIRDKLLSYLSAQAQRAGSAAFDIPFNRQELADYLSVERSALSAELSRMRADGVLQCRKSHFVLARGAHDIP